MPGSGRAVGALKRAPLIVNAIKSPHPQYDVLAQDELGSGDV
jgi:hypothetical protein